MSHDQKISLTKNNDSNYHNQQKDDENFLQIPANSKIKRINRSDPMQWEWSWGPPV